MSLELEEKSIPFGALATNGERNRLALGVVSDDTLVREFREMEVAQRETNALDEFVFEMGVIGSFLRGDGRDEFGERQWRLVSEQSSEYAAAPTMGEKFEQPIGVGAVGPLKLSHHFPYAFGLDREQGCIDQCLYQS
jgi:hypothetical protein